MRSADWAVAHHALSDATPTALLGLVACGAVLLWTVGEPGNPVAAHAQLTWPLLPLAAAAMWAGIGVLGEANANMAHTLARPLHRGRWLVIRAIVHAAALGAVGAVVQFFSANVWAQDPGPPLALVVGLIITAFGVGVVAGACATTETGAVGGTVVGLALMVAPILTLTNFYRVPWPRVTSALGDWMWPAACMGGAALVWPLWHVVRLLPLRQPRRIAVGIAAITALHAAAVVVIWQPAASRATSAEHGDRMAIGGTHDGPRVVYTGTEGTVDGVYIERDGQQLPVFGGGARRSHVLEGRLSPDGSAIALLVRPFDAEGRRIEIVDLHSGDRMTTTVEAELFLGAWSPDSTELVFVATSQEPRLSVAKLADATVRELSAPLGLHHAGVSGWHSRVVGWREGSIVMLDSAGYRHVLRLVPATGGDITQTMAFSARARPAVSDAAVAWLSHDGQPDAPAGSEHRWTLMIQGWEPGAQRVSVDLGTWASASVTGLGFLDENHLYAELAEADPTRPAGQRDRTKRLVVVDRSGEIRSVVDQRRGQDLHSLRGSPQGPWIATDVYGGTGRLHPNGQTLPKTLGRNLGNRSTPWIPMRTAPNGVEFIDFAGQPAEMQLTDVEEAQ